MGFVRDRRQRVTAEFLRNNHSGADLFRTGGRSCANASAGSFRMAGAGCPDIERHGIMDTAEYTFTVGRVYLFSSDMPSCPAELALWGCFAYRAAGRHYLCYSFLGAGIRGLRPYYGASKWKTRGRVSGAGTSASGIGCKDDGEKV